MVAHILTAASWERLLYLTLAGHLPCILRRCDRLRVKLSRSGAVARVARLPIASRETLVTCNSVMKLDVALDEWLEPGGQALRCVMMLTYADRGSLGGGGGGANWQL